MNPPLTGIKADSRDPRHSGSDRHGDHIMFGFIGDYYPVLAIAAAALFIGVVGFVSIEDMLRRG